MDGDINLLDQTFSELVGDNENVNPLQQSMNLQVICSPKTMLNSKVRPQDQNNSNMPMTPKDLQISVKIIEQLEMQEKKLSHQEKERLELIETNKLLKKKVIEFQK